MSEPTFQDQGLTRGKVFFYAVKAVGNDGQEGAASFRARTQPTVPAAPVVSVLAVDQVEVRWATHPAKDVKGYNVYRGLATVRTVQKGTPSDWKDNDPEYAEPLPVEVRTISNIQKLNDQLLTGTTFLDKVDLRSKGAEVADYKYAVYAYIVRAVNQLGAESGPSPYALTIPSEPTHVLNREKGAEAEIKWQANPEKGIVGYRIYKLEGTWKIVRLTDAPIKETTFRHKSAGTTRYWVVGVDALGQEGQPSSPVWHQHSYPGYFQGEWHQ